MTTFDISEVKVFWERTQTLRVCVNAVAFYMNELFFSLSPSNNTVNILSASSHKPSKHKLTQENIPDLIGLLATGLTSEKGSSQSAWGEGLWDPRVPPRRGLPKCRHLQRQLRVLDLYCWRNHNC